MPIRLKKIREQSSKKQALLQGHITETGHVLAAPINNGIGKQSQNPMRDAMKPPRAIRCAASCGTRE
jgi:hypothetical protein